MKITNKTRRESYRTLNRVTVNERIISILEDAGKPLTARQVAELMYKHGYIPHPIRQAAAPRLTELEELGVVKVCGKIYDKATGRNVAAYKLVEVLP